MSNAFINSTLTDGANDGSTWADAYRNETQLDWTSAATRASDAGDIIYVAHNNNTDMTGNATFVANANHTEENPLKIIVTNSSTSIPVDNYGTAGNGELDAQTGAYDMVFQGWVSIYGLRYLSPDGHTITNHQLTLENSLFLMADTGNETYPIPSATHLSFINSDIDFSNANHGFILGGDGSIFSMIGGSITTDSNVTDLFRINSSKSGRISLIGTDLSGVDAATGMLLNPATSEHYFVDIKNCKMPSTMPTLITGTVGNMRLSDGIVMSGNTGELSAQYLQGYLESQTTVNRTDGANHDGSTLYSLKIESASTATRAAPLRHLITRLNYGDLNGTDVTVHFAQNSGTALKPHQIWIEMATQTSTGTYFLSSASKPSITNDADYTDETSNVDWNDGAGDLSGYAEQSITVSPAVTTEELIYIWLCVAEDFSTNNLYVDPKPVIA